ncbi:putative oxidoreductase subunit with NAD(P)-binding domain and ferridoxin-like domain [Sterolibacterium denitrificans]|uniref:Oxidoreductase subunit with NAD(P)-binding domain and ferridoxin-like domain n=1 Tax=Sterolibacterium denitrificans TaxID=157592 RepID=A0A7Z7HQ99_9PROT|nr:LutB/LldF family L-lactate oxidation iron-sulfur protein [Sterolibacterium denitrificans]SMB24218.1 putative oxidoreductase subunit with NAD(P)-binding domain and ferridoxin-like domain [Sterolibacterium denitrificans]
MEAQAVHFKARVAGKLADAGLQRNLRRTRGKFVDKRARAVAELDDFEALRNAAQGVRDRVLADLDLWLERFEAEATRRGATVLWARDGAEVCRLTVEIAQRHGVDKAVKSKSMLSEEAALNQALAAAGIQPMETDLGEYILQINGNEPPSHIVAPVVHKSKEEISALFARIHGRPATGDIHEMTREAREMLRPHFLSAGMGISGGNFLVAETGSLALVTNEGNGRLVTTLPKVHVAITGIEKIVPTLEDLATLMRLLPRSATGQSISNYFSVLTGPRAAGESDGPEHMYFILVDNGRADLVGSEYAAMLRCIRCGACMNHCPVYQSIGGQAYGWVYPGPMGSVLTPLLGDFETASELPQASTLCGQCAEVCPVKIPLPGLLRQLREERVKRHLRPFGERLMLGCWAWLALHPRLYAIVTRLASRYLRWLGGSERRIRVFTPLPEWTLARDLPAPSGRSFREQYAKYARRRPDRAA